MTEKKRRVPPRKTPYPKPKRKGKGRVTPAAFLKVIPGTGGVKTEIARRLGVVRSTVEHILRNPKGDRSGPLWDKCREAWRQEIDAVADLAEGTVKHCIEQREDLRVALHASTWHLSKRRPTEYGDKTNVVLSGDKDNPLQVESRQLINIEVLPLDVRRNLLQAIQELESSD